MSQKKIKVLLCSPIGKKGVGGIAKWTQQLLSYYEEIKGESDIELYYYYPEGRTVYGGVGLIRRVIYGLQSYVPFLFGLRKRLSEDKYDVTHFCSSASISLLKDILSLKIARMKGVRSIIHFHFGRAPEICKAKNWEYRLLTRVIKLADIATFIDEASYNALYECGFRNLKLLPNPLSTVVANLIAKNSSVVRSERKIVFAGHAIVTKGVVELVEACSTIDNIELVMLGFVREEMKERLMQIAGADNNWLHIMGEQSSDTVIKEMLSAAAFVLPTYSEGFPNVIIESMACGCPIVTTPVGAIPEMLDIKNGENCGLCVEPRNVEQIRSAIQRMLSDRAFALKCGENACKRVNELYSMGKVWKQMEEMWKATCD